MKKQTGGIPNQELPVAILSQSIKTPVTMKTAKTRKEAINLALRSIRGIYEAVREGSISHYYGKKLANRYWEKLNHTSSLHWLSGRKKHEYLSALKYFGLISPEESRGLQKKRPTGQPAA